MHLLYPTQHALFRTGFEESGKHHRTGASGQNRSDTTLSKGVSTPRQFALDSNGEMGGFVANGCLSMSCYDVSRMAMFVNSLFQNLHHYLRL